MTLGTQPGYSTADMAGVGRPVSRRRWPLQFSLGTLVLIVLSLSLAGALWFFWRPWACRILRLENQIIWAAVSPDGRRLATAEESGIAVTIRDLDSFQIRSILEAYENAVFVHQASIQGRLDWSLDSRCLGLISDDLSVRVWNVETGWERCRLPGQPASQCFGIWFTADEQHILVHGDEIRSYELGGKAEPVGRMIGSLKCVSPDRRLVCIQAFAEEWELRVCDANTLDVIHTYKPNDGSELSEVSFDANSAELIITISHITWIDKERSFDYPIGQYKSNTRVLNLNIKSGSVVQVKASSHSTPERKVQLRQPPHWEMPGGRHILRRNPDGSLVILNKASEDLVAELSGFNASASTFEPIFSVSGDRILLANYRFENELWIFSKRHDGHGLTTLLQPLHLSLSVALLVCLCLLARRIWRRMIRPRA